MSNPQQLAQSEQHTPGAPAETNINDLAARAWKAYAENKLPPVEQKQTRRERLLALFQQSATHS